MKQIVIIGAGPGRGDYILPAAYQEIETCDWISGDQRVLESFSLNREDARVHLMHRIPETLEQIKERPDEEKIGVLVSGDPLMYSMYRLVRRTFPTAKLSVIPGISSVQAFAAALGETLEDSRIISAHGRKLRGEALAEIVKTNEKVFILCDSKRTPAWIGGQLAAYVPEISKMAAGCYITYPEERILEGHPESFVNESFPSLSIVMVKNPKAAEEKGFRLLQDQDFMRNHTPMTREEIRWIILGKLGMSGKDVLWDIGAGTGSISVEAARSCPQGKVISVEKDERALKVLSENMERMAPGNMEIVAGRAAEVMKDLPKPTHVFIGGSDGEMEAVLEEVCQRGEKISLIISCVTLETMSKVYQLCQKNQLLEAPEVLTIYTEHSRALGRYHTMERERPVTLMMTATRSTACQDGENTYDK